MTLCCCAPSGRRSAAGIRTQATVAGSAPAALFRLDAAQVAELRNEANSATSDRVSNTARAHGNPLSMLGGCSVDATFRVAWRCSLSPRTARSPKRAATDEESLAVLVAAHISRQHRRAAVKIAADAEAIERRERHVHRA